MNIKSRKSTKNIKMVVAEDETIKSDFKNIIKT